MGPGAATNFASLSESLSKSITAINRIGLEERRDEETLAGAAAAEGISDLSTLATEAELVNQGVIPKSASKYWRRGFYNTAGRNLASQFREEVLVPWMRENTAGEALVDEKGMPVRRKNALMELNELRKKYIKESGFEGNSDFMSGFNAYSRKDLERTATQYTEYVNKWEEERVGGFIIGDTADALEEWFESEGAIPSEDSLGSFRDKVRSLIDGYEVPLGEDISGLTFQGIEQFAREAIRDGDMDLDAVGAFVESLFSTNGYNGNRNYADDPRYAEGITRILNALETAEENAFKDRERQVKIRTRELQAEAEGKYGAGQYDSSQLLKLKADLANGTGEFEGINKQDQEILLGYWSSLMTNAGAAQRGSRQADTQRVEDYITRNFEHLTRESAERIVTESMGVDRASLLKLIDNYYSGQDIETRRQVEGTMGDPAIEGALKSLDTLLGPLGAGDRALFQEQAGSLESALRREVERAYSEGRPESVPGLVQRFQDEAENLRRRATERKAETESSIDGARKLRESGQYEKARESLEGMSNISADDRKRELAYLDAQEESERNDHIIGGNGIVSELFARARVVLPESTGFLKSVFGEPEIKSSGMAEVKTDAMLDSLGQMLQEKALDYQKANRGKAGSYSEYQEGLRQALTKEFNELLIAFSGEEEAAVLIQGLRAEGTIADRFRQMMLSGDLSNPEADPYATTPEVQEAIEKSRLFSGESQVRREFREGEAVIADIDPANTGRDLSFTEALKANEYFYLEDTQGSARSVEEFRLATIGFSPQEIRDGSVTVEIPESVKERLRASRQSVESFVPGVGTWSLRSSLPGFKAVTDDIDYFFMPSMDQMNQRRQALLNHYDRLLAAEPKSVTVDVRRISQAVSDNPKGVLVFQTEDQIAAFERDPEHIYRRAFSIPDTSAANFANRQRDLLRRKKAEAYIK